MRVLVHICGDFFEATRWVTTSVPLRSAVAFADLLEEAGRKVFGEESYKDYLEDMAAALADEYDVSTEEEWERVWPKGHLLPRYPPKGERAREIYEKRRAQVLEYARLIKEYIKQGHIVAEAVYSDEKQPHEYAQPHASWTYDVDKYNKGKVKLLVKL